MSSEAGAGAMTAEEFVSELRRQNIACDGTCKLMDKPSCRVWLDINDLHVPKRLICTAQVAALAADACGVPAAPPPLGSLAALVDDSEGLVL